MNNTPCPNSRELLDFQRGTLPSDERIDWISRHLDACDACVAALRAADQLAATAARVAGPTAPGAAQYLDEPEFHVAFERIQQVPAWAARLSPGDRVGDYEVLERIGAGGMGAVYRAWHPRLRRHVVLKRLRERVAMLDWRGRQRAVEMFRGEMAVLGQLDDSRVVKAYDALEHEGDEYLVMEFVAGRNLRAVVSAQGPMSVANACRIAREIALGLVYLHARGVVHRDIKPSNVALGDDGSVKILDLGLAIAMSGASGDATVGGSETIVDASDSGQPGAAGNGEPSWDEKEGTRTSVWEGTLDFMAPEQAAASQRVGAAADLYSLGATLYFLLVGDSPRAALRTIAAKRAVLRAAAPISLEALPRSVPARLRRLLARLLDPQPHRRPSSTREVVDLLSPWCANLAADATVTPWTPVRLVSLAMGLVGSLVLLLVLGFKTLEWRSAADRGARSARTESESESRADGEGGSDEASGGGVRSNQPSILVPDNATSAERPRQANDVVERPTISPPTGDRPRYRSWRPGSPFGQMNGLALAPATFGGIERWQVDTVRPRGAVRALAVHPAATHFALIGDDGHIRVFQRTESGSRLERLLPGVDGERDAARSLAWSPDGKWLAAAVAEGDGRMDVWDWQASARRHEWRGHVGGVKAIAWSPQGDRLASVGEEGKLRIWDLSGIVEVEYEFPGEPCTSVSWRLDGQELAVGTLLGRVWGCSAVSKNIREIAGPFDSPVLDVACSPAARRLVVVTRDHVVRLVGEDPGDSPSGKFTLTAPFRDLCWDSTGRRVVILTDRLLFTWQVDGLKLREDAVGGWSPEVWSGLEAEGQGEAVWVVSTSGRVRRVNMEHGVELVREAPWIYLADLAWDRRSARIAVCGAERWIQVWGGQGKPHSVLESSGGNVRGYARAAWRRDGTMLAALELETAQRIHIWRVEDSRHVAAWDLASPARSFAWSEDGEWLVAGGHDGRVEVWKVDEQRALPGMSVHETTISDVAPCPHTQRFVSADLSGVVIEWELNDSGAIQSRKNCARLEESVHSIAWSPQGDRIAIAGTHHVWMKDSKNGTTLWRRECPIPPGRVYWKGDGERMYVNALGLLKSADGSTLSEASIAPSPANLSPDGRWIATTPRHDSVLVSYAGGFSPLWIAAPVAADAHVTLSFAGQIQYHKRSFEDDLVYFVERGRGEFETMRPSEFEQLIQRRISK